MLAKPPPGTLDLHTAFAVLRPAHDPSAPAHVHANIYGVEMNVNAWVSAHAGC